MNYTVSVDIVVLTALSFTDLTTKFIDSIKQHVHNDYRIIQVDNGSEKPVEFEGVTNILLKKNYGFARGMNLGMSQRRENSDVIICNNDIEVTTGWMDYLIATKNAHPNAGIISPMNSGTCCNPRMTRKEEDNNREDFMVRNGPAICWYIPNSTIQKVGMFDINYEYGWAEDMDYCQKVINAHLDIWISAKAFIRHKGSVTQKANKVTVDYRRKNMEYFQAKWGDMRYNTWIQRAKEKERLRNAG